MERVTRSEGDSSLYSFNPVEQEENKLYSLRGVQTSTLKHLSIQYTIYGNTHI